MKIRILALITVLGMLLTIIPMTASAAEPEEVTTFEGLRTALQRSISEETPENPSVVEVTASFSIPGNVAVIAVKGHKTLIANGQKQISRGSMERTLINVDGGTLNIGVRGDNVNVLTFDGTPSKDIYSSIISVNNSGTLNIYTGVFCNNKKISDNNNSGGTIDVNNNSIVNIYEATIKDNTIRTTGSHGGNIYIRNGSTVTIDGATIKDNKCQANGGGIYVTSSSADNPSKLIFKSGEIRGNTASDNYGNNKVVGKSNAINVGSNAIFEMYGGTIEGAIDDTVSAGGNDSSLIEMSAAATATIYGGTIIGDAKIRRIISSAGSLTMTARQGSLGATVRNGGNNSNNDNQEAAAVYLSGSAVFTINAGVIKDFNGRAIATTLTAAATINLYGGKIKGCENPVVKNNITSNSSTNMGGDFWMTGYLFMGKAGNTIKINSNLTNKSAIVATLTGHGTGSTPAPLANGTTVLSGLIADNAHKFVGIATSGGDRLGVNPANGQLSNLPELSPPEPEQIIEYVKILGNVLDEGGAPVENAEIWAEEELLGKTDNNGCFIVEMPVSESAQQLVIKANGFADLEDISVTPGDDKAIGNFAMTSGGDASYLELDFDGPTKAIISTNMDVNGTLIVASYVGKTLVFAQTFTVAISEEGDYDFDLIGFVAGDRTKVMLWDSLDTITPLVASENF